MKVHSAKYNVESTIDVLKEMVSSIRREVGDIKFANAVSKNCNGKVYVYFDNNSAFMMFVKVANGTYFCVEHDQCYDINDNLVENDPHFYDWVEYRKMFPGKSLVIEDYFSPINKDNRMY